MVHSFLRDVHAEMLLFSLFLLFSWPVGRLIVGLWNMNSVLFARLSGLILNYFAAILVREIVFKEFNDVVIEIISEQLAEVNLKVERAARAVYLFVDTDEMLLLAKAAATEVRDWD